MNWEKKFSTIVHETEVNLDRVRRRLEAARSNADIEIPCASAVLTLEKTAGGVRAGGDYSTSRIAAFPPKYSAEMSSAEISTSPPVWATVLDEKIAKQRRTINTLTETVVSLQNEKEKHKSEIDGLKDTVASLMERMEEKGVNLDTENKINQWKQETSHAINDLKLKMSFHKGHDIQRLTSASSAATVEELVSQVNGAKALCREETESTRKDIDYYKTRMIRLEKNITVLTEELADLSHKHNNLKSVMAEIADQSKSDCKALSKSISERITDLSVARNEMYSLKADFTDGYRSPRRGSLPLPNAHLALKNRKAEEKPREPTEWRELLSHSLSSISIDSKESTLSSGYLARKRSNDSTNDDIERLLAGGLVDSSSEDESLNDQTQISTPSSSPTSLNINDL